MEAMFDRMDCVGKGDPGPDDPVRPVPQPQVRPADAGRVLPDVRLPQQLRTRRTSRCTRPKSRRRSAKIGREIREIEELIKHHNPDWPERMAAWEKAGLRRSARVGGRAAGGRRGIDRGRRSTMPMEDGSFLVQGYAPTKHTVVMSVKTDDRADHGVSPGAAQRPEPAAGRARAVRSRGRRRLTEFSVEAAPADGKGKPIDVKFSRATADVNPPETPLDPIFDDKSGKKRVTGPIGFAIDGKDETAWGIDVGPGRRNQPRKAVFTAEKPIAFPGGAILTFHLTQNHGGWNSDDNQNHNLGRFRLSITTAAGATADPVPRRVRRDPGDPARATQTDAQAAAVFSYWRTTVPGMEGANAWIDSL